MFPPVHPTVGARCHGQRTFAGNAAPVFKLLGPCQANHLCRPEEVGRRGALGARRPMARVQEQQPHGQPSKLPAARRCYDGCRHLARRIPGHGRGSPTEAQATPRPPPNWSKWGATTTSPLPRPKRSREMQGGLPSRRLADWWHPIGLPGRGRIHGHAMERQEEHGGSFVGTMQRAKPQWQSSCITCWAQVQWGRPAPLPVSRPGADSLSWQRPLLRGLWPKGARLATDKGGAKRPVGPSTVCCRLPKQAAPHCSPRDQRVDQSTESLDWRTQRQQSGLCRSQAGKAHGDGLLCSWSMSWRRGMREPLAAPQAQRSHPSRSSQDRSGHRTGLELSFAAVGSHPGTRPRRALASRTTPTADGQAKQLPPQAHWLPLLDGVWRARSQLRGLAYM